MHSIRLKLKKHDGVERIFHVFPYSFALPPEADAVGNA
jgi:hypothetical protein